MFFFCEGRISFALVELCTNECGDTTTTQDQEHDRAQAIEYGDPRTVLLTATCIQISLLHSNNAKYSSIFKLHNVEISSHRYSKIVILRIIRLKNMKINDP